jgi:glutamate--cysteine ligase
VLKAMTEGFDDCFADFVRLQSEQTRQQLLAMPFDKAMAERFARMAQQSQTAQADIETLDSLPFEAFRQQYLSAAAV